MKYLQLEETIFEGFGEGCTILFYSILKIDAVLLAPKFLSHSAELKRMFDITHLVVLDFFACDLEGATIELPVRVCVCCIFELPQILLYNIEPPVSVCIYTTYHQTLCGIVYCISSTRLGPKSVRVLLYNIH